MPFFCDATLGFKKGIKSTSLNEAYFIYSFFISILKWTVFWVAVMDLHVFSLVGQKFDFFIFKCHIIIKYISIHLIGTLHLTSSQKFFKNCVEIGESISNAKISWCHFLNKDMFIYVRSLTFTDIKTRVQRTLVCRYVLHAVVQCELCHWRQTFIYGTSRFTDTI